MSNASIKIRVNRSTGELELEGPQQLVSEWWDKVWPELSQEPVAPTGPIGSNRLLMPPRSSSSSSTGLPEVFGEFYTEFRSDITDTDRVLVAGAFVQDKEPEKTFTTKSANQLLLDQNIKVGNPSEAVRRLISSKRAFVVSDGRFRVSATGLEYLQTLKANP